VTPEVTQRKKDKL
jgi:hypothetical protein